MIFINGVAFEKVGSQIWIVSCTAPLHRTYTIVSAERQYLCSTYFGYTYTMAKPECQLLIFPFLCTSAHTVTPFCILSLPVVHEHNSPVNPKCSLFFSQTVVSKSPQPRTSFRLLLLFGSKASI
jgi:hypothetical protein